MEARMKITKTASGKWTTLISLTDSDGKRRFKRFTAKDKATCRNLANDYLNRHHTYMESMAFSDSLKRYIDARDGIKSPSTIRGYRSIERELSEKYPGFASKSCDRISEQDMQTVIDDMIARGRSEKTIRNYVGLIRSVLAAEHIVPPRSILPEKKIPEYICPTAEDVRRILNLVAGTKLDVPVRLALMGLRRGEICAISGEDLSGDNVLHIHKSRVYDADGFIVTKDTPKRAASNRYIRLPADIADAIRAAGRATTLTPAGLSEAWTYLLHKHGFPPYRLHDTRHFFASYCHSIGIPEADILAGGGWKTGHVMKNVYRHAMSDNAATESMASFLNSQLQAKG